jgi:hypothetical protein
MSATTHRPVTLDGNLQPNRDVPKWSETRWNGCWNPDHGVGLYLHMGRFRDDLELWWAQTVAYLPNGRLVVDRSWGRQTDVACVRTGVFELENTAAGWRSRYDGAPQLTTLEALVQAPQGSAAPSVPVRWQVDAEPVSPVWDLYSGRHASKEVFAGDTHIQQAYATAGELTVGDRTYRLDGVGYKDHSSGARVWDGYGAHNFLLAVMPGWSMHAIMLYGPNGEPRGPLGAVFRDGKQIPLARFELEPLTGLLEDSRSYAVTIGLAGGETLDLVAERLHEVPITITDEGDNVTGIDWMAALPATVIQEAAAKLTMADGTVGYSFFERGARRQALERPRAVDTHPDRRSHADA